MESHNQFRIVGHSPTTTLKGLCISVTRSSFTAFNAQMSATKVTERRKRETGK
jgi:hypothetical protein